jgi:PAS domain S-box-containing protein
MVDYGHFYNLVEHAPEGIVTITESGNIIYANKAISSLTGRKKDEIENSGSEIFFSQDASTLESIFKTNGGIENGEYKILHSSGSLIPVEISSKQYVNEGEKYYSVFFKDISRRKTKEKDLQEQNERLKILVDSAFEGIAINNNGVLLDANPVMARMFGYTFEELKGISATDIVTEDCIATVEYNIKRNYAFPYQVTGKRKDGSTFPLEICGKSSTYKGRDVRITSFRDITDKVNAEKELKSYEIKFQTLFQNGSDMLGLLNESGEYTYVAPSVERILGYKPEELIGISAIDLIHPQDKENALSKLEQAFTHKTVTVPDFRIRHANGNYVWIETVLDNMLDNKHVRAISASSRDITKRKEAEIALKYREEDLRVVLREIQVNEQKFRSLFERNPDAAFSFNTEGIITSANGTFRDIFQTDISDIKGQHVLAFFNVSDDKDIKRKVQSALAGISDTFISQFVNLKGEFVKVRVTVIPIVIDNKVTGAYCIAKNITELWQNEERLHAIKQMLESATANVDIKALLNDFLFKIEHIYVSVQCTITLLDKNKLYHYVAPSLPKDILTFINGTDIAELNGFSANAPALVLDVLEYEENSRFKEIAKKLGIEAYVYYPLISATGEIMGFLAFNYKDKSQFNEKDIELISQLTKLISMVLDNRNSLDSIKRKNKQLQKINTELDRFSYSTSHELRAPLTSIKGLVNLAINYGEYSREVHDCLKMIEKSTVKLENFILEIGDYYRNKSTVVNYEPVHLYNLVNSIIKNVKLMQEANGVSFNIDIDPALCIFSDAQRLDIMITNLLLNAVKYSDETKREKVVDICASKNHENYISIGINDNGIGIAESCLPKVCNMFYRATEISNGSGLGLYIVKEVVNRLRGKMEIKSSLGKGTFIDIALPANAAFVN